MEHPLDARLRRKLECTSATSWMVVIADSWEHEPSEALWVLGAYTTEAEAEAAAANKRARGLTEGEACYVYPPSPDGTWKPGA